MALRQETLNAARREDLRVQQNNLLAPYQALSHSIDTILLQIDQVKLQLETFITQNP